MPLTAILVEDSKTIRDNLIPAMAELADIEVSSHRIWAHRSTLASAKIRHPLRTSHAGSGAWNAYLSKSESKTLERGTSRRNGGTESANSSAASGTTQTKPT